VGLSVGPFIGGFLTQLLGWRSLFFINVPLGLVPLFLVLWVLKGEWAGAKGEKFDLAGSLLYSLMLISLMYGFTRLPGHLGKLMVLAGLLGFVGLIWWESRAKSPVLDVMLFRKNRVYAFSNLAALINYSATFAVGFLMSLYLQYIKGLEPLAAGTILVAQPLMMAVFSPFAGRLSDKIEPRIVASFGMALTFAGVLIFTFIQADTSISFIVAGLVFLGIGIAFFSSPNTNAIMSSIERRHYGVGSATLGTMRLVGQVLSMGVVMLVLAVYMGRVEILRESYPEFMASMKTAFTICTLLCFIGIFASLARGDMRAKPQ
jgi:MFS family permease